MTELVALTAAEAVEKLTAGDVSPLELIDAALARIEAVDGAVNALPTLCADQARDAARRLTEAGRPAKARTWLAGLPMVVKDLNDTAGVRTTYGSPIYADHVPDRSDIMVEVLEANGAVCMAKSNTPEFGAGGNTFNEVFGRTLNPWNTGRTCGGSSGGAAVALATGMAWLATGSDLGGSLRTPASFCGVVGFRPSPGIVPRWPTAAPFHTLSVDGPMARTVTDAALMLDAMAAQHPEDPISRPPPATPYSEAVRSPARPARIAFSPDLGGLSVDREVRDICAASMQRFADIGVPVEEACPDLRDAREIFHTLRALLFVINHRDHLEHHRDRLKPDVIWNIEKGMAQTVEDLARAEAARAALYARTAAFFGAYDILACPAVQVPPFPVEQRYVEEIEGERFDNYMDWLEIAYAVSLTSCPAISVPCGMTADGLPVGLQLVGRPRGEAQLLAAARLFEEAGPPAALPIDPRNGG